MHVLDKFGGASDIGQIPPDAVLAAFGSARGATGVHQEERCFRWHGHGSDAFTGKILEHVVDEIITPIDHWRRRAVAPRIPPPHQYLVDRLAFFRGGLHSSIGLFFMIEQRAVSVITIYGD